MNKKEKQAMSTLYRYITLSDKLSDKPCYALKPEELDDC